MKKIILFLVGILMVACSKEVLVDYTAESYSDSRAIVFGTNFKTPGLTRAIIEGEADLQTNKFGVFSHIADYKGADISLNPAKNGFFIYDDTLFYNSGWALENNKRYFWPKAVDNIDANDPVLDFYAFGPRKIETSQIALDDSVITVHVRAIETDSAINDLVFARTLAQTYKKDGAADRAADKLGLVKFNFNHMLSWIVFEAKCDSVFAELTIDSIKASVDTCKANLVINTKAAVKNASLVNIDSAYMYKLDTLHVNKTYRTAGSFVAIPQYLTAVDSATIYYSYVDIAGDTCVNLKAKVRLDTGDLYEDGTDNSLNPGWKVAKWLPSNKYIYRIHFKLREIIFTADVQNWETSNQGPYLIY